MDAAIAGARSPDNYLKVGATMEAAGVMHSFFYTSGLPGAAVAPTPGLAGTALTTYLGQIPFTNPVAGESRLMKLSASSTLAGTLVLVDRLWHNSGLVVTTTTAQTVNSAAWPARDEYGTTNGEDILIGIEVSTATTNASAVTNTTMSYTAADGTAGKTATIASFPATAVAGTFVPFQLAAGDEGVRSIQSVTLGTSYGAGTIHLVAYRVLAQVPVIGPNIGNFVDIISGGNVLLYNNTVPQLLWIPSSTTAVTVQGALTVTQG